MLCILCCACCELRAVLLCCLLCMIGFCVLQETRMEVEQSRMLLSLVWLVSHLLYPFSQMARHPHCAQSLPMTTLTSHFQLVRITLPPHFRSGSRSRSRSRSHDRKHDRSDRSDRSDRGRRRLSRDRDVAGSRGEDWGRVGSRSN